MDRGELETRLIRAGMKRSEVLTILAAFDALREERDMSEREADANDQAWQKADGDRSDLKDRLTLADALAEAVKSRFFEGCGPGEECEYCVEECDAVAVCRALAAYTGARHEATSEGE